MILEVGVRFIIQYFIIITLVIPDLKIILLLIINLNHVYFIIFIFFINFLIPLLNLYKILLKYFNKK